MNIVLVTNTFSPHVGGVARSVQAFREEYHRRGHRVLVVPGDLSRSARATARQFSISRCADTALTCYDNLVAGPSSRDTKTTEKGWEQILEYIRTEWDILKSMSPSASGNCRGIESGRDGRE